MPIIQKAETEIKKLISYYALFLKPKRELIDKIKGIIQAVAKRLPISLYDRQSYISGLEVTAMTMVHNFYDRVVDNFKLIATALLMVGFRKTYKNPIELNKALESDKKLIKFVEQNKSEINVWAMQKGYPNVTEYPKQIKERLNGLAKTQTVSTGDGKKPITVWQKAELDIRYENQLNMVENLKDNNVKLAWISTHPDCSKRCESWQGELVSLTQRASMPQTRVGKSYKYNKTSFLVGKIDNHNVYSLTDIMNVVDQYGYNNNVICGFNCRHKLVPYKPGSVAPQEFSKAEVREQRAINQRLRAMERKIRYFKQQSILYNSISKQVANTYKEKARILTERYKKFANANGYAWYQWRIEA